MELNVTAENDDGTNRVHVLNSRDKVLSNRSGDDKQALDAAIDFFHSFIHRISKDKNSFLVMLFEMVLVKLFLLDIWFDPNDLQRDNFLHLELVLVRNLDKFNLDYLRFLVSLPLDNNEAETRHQKYLFFVWEVCPVCWQVDVGG